MERRTRCCGLALPAILTVLCGAARAASPPLLEVMRHELDRSMDHMSRVEPYPVYFLNYGVTEERGWSLEARDGGLLSPRTTFSRYLDVDLRIGTPQLDNTHEIRGGGWRDNYRERRVVEFPIEADTGAVRAALWAETEYQFQKAKERFTTVLGNRQVKVAEEDTSPDFSPGVRESYADLPTYTVLDTLAWREIVQRTAQYLAGFDFVYSSQVTLGVLDRTTAQVNTDGTGLQQENHYLRFILSVSGMADDGMELYRPEVFSAASPEHLPDEATIRGTAERLVRELQALAHAPLVEPYIGPAILKNRASGVFFHEIFGHRIEAHRQKSTTEGQTFTKKVGEKILPDFISVFDDPSLATFAGKDLRGFYRFDDQGVPGERVGVVESGVLRNFLCSRSPIANFPRSNGHGRRDYGFSVVSRMGNLLVESSRQVPFDRLRQMLVEEIRRQGKPYGLIFDDISGGFTMTGRRGPQAFKVLPLFVTRVYADGRPDEVVRGVDIVGTPLTSFSKILITGDDADVFNGTCGAESGGVPVSAISPSILVSEIEVEKRQKEQEKPPILPPPGPKTIGLPGSN
jgi:predicted Zn-dependent protease